MMKQTVTALIAVILFFNVSSVQATDQNRPVRDVIIVDVNDDLDGFLDRMKRVKGVADRLQLPVTMRVFMGTFAATHNGDIFLYWELPSFIEFAEAETALHQDAEFLSILAEMDAAGQSFTSEFLTIEITK
ncbi:hypothetical protein [Kordiimonas aquimaris]|uniref:hypothetical protein n=1 Tax=Kordiimonas aquimaris TaxID=707591 RepID=UPI0021D303F4|nr:hypothetical protein [Kordiimonas aquimaris]